MTSSIEVSLFELLGRGGIKAAVLMSGGGSNARNLLSSAWRFPGVKICLLVTNSELSGARLLSTLYGVRYSHVPYDSRTLFFKKLAEILLKNGIELLLYAGFMKLAPRWFVRKFPGINVHPADLSIRSLDGRPLLTGLDCIGTAVKAGHLRLACTVHVVDEQMDEGRPLVIARGPTLASNSRCDRSHQERHERIKQLEHLAYPLALCLMSRTELRLADAPLELELSQYGG